MKKLAIIGASYLQRPLVEKAYKMGLETHVFAWRKGEMVSDIATRFYPISILEKDQILRQCKKIGIDGITSIASDIAMNTVNAIANELGLTGNSPESTLISTDKHEMRLALHKGGVSCPRFELYTKPEFKDKGQLEFPVIVKPADRSGSRGVTKVTAPDQVNQALEKALKYSISGKAIVEEFILGQREFSVEMISFRGQHHFIAITDKVTTGEPYFVETEHHQPANIDDKLKEKIIWEVKKGLDTLKIEYGASHSEVLLTENGQVRIVEIAGRMGGELIGSDMVHLSTGYDFVKGTIEVALGSFTPFDHKQLFNHHSGVFYVLPPPGVIKKIEDHSTAYPNIVKALPILEVGNQISATIDGAGKRAGIFVYWHPSRRLNFNPNEVLRFITK